MPVSSLTRTLSLGSVGTDVEALKRAVYRFLGDDNAWTHLIHSSPLVRRTFGPFFQFRLKQAQAKLGLVPDGVIGPATEAGLRLKGAFDATADLLLQQYADSHVPLWYPQQKALRQSVCQGLHQTSGLPNNFAMDFCAPGGTVVVASFDCEITRWSGHDPMTGTHGPAHDVFGWSVYVKRKDGTEGFLTHLGSRVGRPGTSVKGGTKIGTVGNWPHDPGRSHTHFGLTSPQGTSVAKALITAISRGPKVPAV